MGGIVHKHGDSVGAAGATGSPGVPGIPGFPGIPDIEELLARAHVVSLPTRTRFRGITEREAVIFAGPKRWSEFSPFTEYGDQEAAVWLNAAIEFGWHDLPSVERQTIAVNATIPAVVPAQVQGILARFPGCTTIKVKVAERGQNLADDVARVREVRRITGAAAKIRLDANGAWSETEALGAIRELSQFDLDYVEQPVLPVAGLARVREALAGEVKIAADESVRRASDPLEVARLGACDLIVVKAQPLGGITSALKIISEAGLPVVISSALDTSIGLSMGAHLAAALPDGQLYGACGLGTAALLSADVTHDPLLPMQGEIAVRKVSADPELLQTYAASAERTRFWRERITRAHATLATLG